MVGRTMLKSYASLCGLFLYIFLFLNLYYPFDGTTIGIKANPCYALPNRRCAPDLHVRVAPP